MIELCSFGIWGKKRDYKLGYYLTYDNQSYLFILDEYTNVPDKIMVIQGNSKDIDSKIKKIKSRDYKQVITKLTPKEAESFIENFLEFEKVNEQINRNISLLRTEQKQKYGKIEQILMRAAPEFNPMFSR